MFKRLSDSAALALYRRLGTFNLPAEEGVAVWKCSRSNIFYVFKTNGKCTPCQRRKVLRIHRADCPCEGAGVKSTVAGGRGDKATEVRYFDIRRKDEREADRG